MGSGSCLHIDCVKKVGNIKKKPREVHSLGSRGEERVLVEGHYIRENIHLVICHRCVYETAQFRDCLNYGMFLCNARM